MYADIAEEDEHQILELVASLPDVDRRIVSITRYSNGEVHVMTGELLGDRIGGGDSISIEKVDNRWRVKRVGSWFA